MVASALTKLSGIIGIIPWNPNVQDGVPTNRRSRASASKQSRAASICPIIEAGNVHLPEGAPWLAAFIEECASFPLGKHDDQVDAMSQALQYGSRSGIAQYQALTRIGLGPALSRYSGPSARFML